MDLTAALLVLAGYLLGSLSSAIIVCRLMGLPDPRQHGSKNPGATNVLRFGNKKAAVVTLLGDLLKGLIPVLIARALGSDAQTLALVAMAAFLGHLYPVFFGFRGGKGVATGVGVILGLTWPVALAAAATWLLMAKVFKISSLSALIASALTPLYAWLLGEPQEYLYMFGVMTVLLIWRHRSNIRNLLSGAESTIGR